MGNANAADILRNLNFDWFMVDWEHSAIGPETLNHMIQVIGSSKVVPFVRVGLNDQYLIKLALDAGAYGVLVPLVNTKADAERAVNFSMYPPRGTRGTASTRASGYGVDSKEYLRTANDEVMVMTQVETRAALDSLDDILSVKGVDVAFVGPSDLTMSLGLINDRSNPQVVEAMKKVVAGCKKHGKIPGVMASSPDELKRAIDLGFKFISLASDVRFLMQGARTFLSAAGRT
jgi:2-keto-3-deoxy-L-rhamnonate aldolase RhmA